MHLVISSFAQNADLLVRNGRISTGDSTTTALAIRANRIIEVESTPFNGFGEVVKDAAGKPIGVLKEGAKNPVARHIPKTTLDQQRTALTQGLNLAASPGIASIQNASRGAGEIDLYAELYRQNKLILRASLAVSATATTDISKFDTLSPSD